MPNFERKIYINNDLDIVTARMQVRELAKEMGFRTADQARISLAASELARVISWNTDSPGQIVLSNANRNGNNGLLVKGAIQLKYLSAESQADDSSLVSVPCRSLSGARQLVDESFVEKQNNHQALVTLIKWLT